MNKKNKICTIICLMIASFCINIMFINIINAQELILNSYVINSIRQNACIKEKNQKSKEITKKVFLTFDDGPSINNTRKIIKILKDNNVKATFFVIGCKGEEYSDIIKELKEAKMSIQSHTYSHDYKIYKSTDEYIDDLEKCKTSIEKITGGKVGPYVRIPGGSDNLVAKKYILKDIRNRIVEKNMYYVDWNVSSGDALGYNIPRYKIEHNVKKQCKDKDFAVILMHDSYYKRTTVEALPEIIKYLKKEEFQFRTFDDLTEKEKQTMIDMRVINRGEDKAKNKE